MSKTSCPGKPELLKGEPLGMYHCEYCGAMVIAGLPHPTDEQVCELSPLVHTISQCPYCLCMTYTIEGFCGKCKKEKKK